MGPGGTVLNTRHFRADGDRSPRGALFRSFYAEGLTFRIFARIVLSLLLPPRRGFWAALLFQASAKDGRRRPLLLQWLS